MDRNNREIFGYRSWLRHSLCNKRVLNANTKSVSSTIVLEIGLNKLNIFILLEEKKRDGTLSSPTVS